MSTTKSYITFTLILLSNLSFAQTEVKDTTWYVDENGKRQGFEKHPDAFNYAYKEKTYGGYESWTAGYYKDGKKVGTWECTDDKGKLFGYRIYEDNGNYVEVQLRKKKTLSIVKYVKTYEDEKTANYEIVEILSFNKRGKLIKIYSTAEFMFNLNMPAMNPIIWGQEVFRRLQSQQSEKLIDYLYVSQEQMKTAILDEMKTRGVQRELVKKVEEESISAQVYNQLRSEFILNFNEEIQDLGKINWSKAILDSITYNYIIPKFDGPDIEVLWPASKDFEVDPQAHNRADMKLYFSIGRKHYVLSLTPFVFDDQWRLMDPRSFYFTR